MCICSSLFHSRSRSRLQEMLGRASARMGSLLVMLALVSLLLQVRSCNRYRYYGEPCLGFDKEVCDTSRLLRCDLRTGTCQCPDFYYHFWDSYQARCYHRVGTACQEAFGGVREAYYDHNCPENSYCNPGTGYCQCRPLFKQNYEATGCYDSGFRTAQASFLMPLITSISIYIF
jgi:hypothetical protein